MISVEADDRFKFMSVNKAFTDITGIQESEVTGKYIEYGTSPRSTIALFIAAKAHAFLSGKTFVTPMNVKAVAHNILRHRILLNYEGQADEISTDKIIDEILKKVPIP